MKERGSKTINAIRNFATGLFKIENKDVAKATFDISASETLPFWYKLAREEGVLQGGKQKVIILGIGKAEKKFQISLTESLINKVLLVSDQKTEEEMRTLIFKEDTLMSAFKTKDTGKKYRKLSLKEQMDFLMEVKNARFNQMLTFLAKA